MRYYLRYHLLLSRLDALQAIKVGFHTLPLFFPSLAESAAAGLYQPSSSSGSRRGALRLPFPLPSFSLSHTHLRLLLTGSEQLSVQLLLESCAFEESGWSPEAVALVVSSPSSSSSSSSSSSLQFMQGGRRSKTLLYLRQWLESLDEPKLHLFVKFVTGSANLPLNGFTREEDKITFRRLPNSEKHRLPEAHTCFNSVDLPDYNDYGLLAEKLGLKQLFPPPLFTRFNPVLRRHGTRWCRRRISLVLM